MSSDSLNRQFGIADTLSFRTTDSGLIVADIRNAFGEAALCLQGAHLMSWHPAGQARPVVWLSRLAKIAPGKSIRGGVPICWPWFGAHPDDDSFPAHGFARTAPWEVVGTGTAADGATRISLRWVPTEASEAMWAYKVDLQVDMTIGASLRIDMTTRNNDEVDLAIGEALHTYFEIGDIADIRITGLDGAAYLDKVEDFARKTQSGPITFSAETDRVYVNTDSTCVIEDLRLARNIRISKQGSRSTVVWSPWTEKADKMGDFGPDGWREMVCVESANAKDNIVCVRPGETHTLSVEYAVEAR